VTKKRRKRKGRVRRRRDEAQDRSNEGLGIKEPKYL